MTNESTQPGAAPTEELALRSTETEEIVLVPEESAATSATSNVSDTLVSAAAITNVSERASDIPTSPTEARDRLKIDLREESLDVQKLVRQMGEVTITKRVVEEQIQVPVTIRREEITLERKDISVPLDATSSASSQAFGQDQTLTFVLHEEVPVVTKTTRAYQQVEISKRLVSETKTISDSVRREEADIKAPETVRVLDEDKVS